MLFTELEPIVLGFSLVNNLYFFKYNGNDFVTRFTMLFIRFYHVILYMATQSI